VIREISDGDFAEIWRMRRLLHSELRADEEAAETAGLKKLCAGAYKVFVWDRGASLGGFVEVGERPYADGCDSSPVGYIEAWFVDDDLRRSGVGRALIAAAESWARDRGRSEVASDSEISNHGSIAAHQALGYEIAERHVCFVKKL
jgi:aminoglycoside 6'-N-acetyltransferase I